MRDWHGLGAPPRLAAHRWRAGAMQLWVLVTLTAALFQCWRTAMQQKLRGQLSVNAAAVVRYLYGVPVGALLLALYLAGFGAALRAPSWAFAGLCALGGLGQILGTNLLI